MHAFRVIVVHSPIVGNNKATAIFRFQSRYLEQSVSYRGAILWNAIITRHPDLTRPERWTLDSRLSKIKVLRDFHFKATSASTANFRNDDFIYF